MLERNVIFALFLLIMFVSPTNVVSAADEVAPPADDETLIYVMRVGRLMGGGGKIWIAVNDQTVARVKNKGHSIIRAKAGRITLNVATGGMAPAQIAFDDRPGETVYVKYRLGDIAFTEVDEAEAKEFLRKSKQTKPIDEVRANNEEVAVLINLSRLGFDLMRPASDEVVPDADHAVITFFRREEVERMDFGIWGEEGFVGTLSANTAVSIAVAPGDHFFIAGNIGKSLLKVQAEAGKKYYVLLDIGKMIGRVRLTPIELKEAAKLEEWRKNLESIELAPETINERIVEREEIVKELIGRVVEKANAGQTSFHPAGADHAF